MSECHLTVEFAIGDGPVRGVVLGDPPRAFTGWMELIGLFSDLEADASGSPAQVADPPRVDGERGHAS